MIMIQSKDKKWYKKLSKDVSIHYTAYDSTREQLDLISTTFVVKNKFSNNA